MACLAVAALLGPTLRAGASEAASTAHTTEEHVIAVQLEGPFVKAGEQSLYVKRPRQAAGKSWRLRVEMPDAEVPVILRDVSNGRELTRIEAVDARRGTWSAEVTQGEVVLVVPEGRTMAVPLASWEEAAIDTQTPVGTPNLVEVVADDLPVRLRRHIPGIGRLAVLKTPLQDNSGGESRFIYCTAFLVSAFHAVTARHCIDVGLDGRMAELALGYVAGTDDSSVSRHRVSLLEESEALDVAVLALDPPASEKAALRLAAADAPVFSEIMVLQHFAAEPLKISGDSDCVTLDAWFPGPLIWDAERQQAGQVVNALFAHGCDTTSTSSGSPVLNRETYELVGMHQQGFFEGEEPQNRALRVSLLRAFLEEAGVEPVNED